MKLLRRLGSVVTSAGLLAACSSGAPIPAAETSTPDAGSASGTFSLSMQSAVPAGTEAHRCRYVVAPSTGASFIVRGSHSYTPGSHHMLLFRTDLGAVPAGMEGEADCYEGDAQHGFMSHVRGIVYAAQTPEGELVYPTGVGLPIAAGEVFMMQTHYLNASAEPLDARANLDLRLSDGSDVTTHAGILFYYNPFIHVPAGAREARAATRCLVRGDIKLITASSHYHKRGYGYSAFIDPAFDRISTDPFYTSTDWEKPSTLASPFTVSAGSRIRYECVYGNTTGTKDYYQGQSAEDDEMCMFIATYYPALEAADEECTRGRDMIGTGQVGCGDTLSCLRSCPGGFDPSAVNSSHTDVDPCIQSCLVDSCPDATAKLFTLSGCTQEKCATECANAAATGCAVCAAAQCGEATTACLSDACD